MASWKVEIWLKKKTHPEHMYSSLSLQKLEQKAQKLQSNHAKIYSSAYTIR